MSYKAIYRTYRPQTFDEVVGQKVIKQTLENAIVENKINHAYLFCGPRGTGKTTVAKIMAKALMCENGLCGECEKCVSVAEGSHPDVVEIDAASNNSVEDIRDLIDKIKYAPLEAKHKIYIIDEVHMMSASAFNAFLKTLEEPPEHVVFILATTEPHKILPTILSRCQRFDFTSVSIEDLQERLNVVLKEEGVTCDPEAVKIVAKLANGGVRDALSILEQCLAYNPGELTIETIGDVYGIVSLEEKISLISDIIDNNVKGVVDKIQSISDKGSDVKLLTLDLIDIFKDVVIYRSAGNAELLLVCDESDINKMSADLTTEKAFANIEILIESLQKYKHTTSSYLYFELACLKMVVEKPQEVVYSNMPQQVNNPSPILESVSNIVNTPTIDSVKEKDETEEVNIIKPTKEIVKIKPVEIDKDHILNILVQADKQKRIEMEERWSSLHRYLNDIDFAKAASFLDKGVVRAVTENVMVVVFDSQPLCNRVNDKINQPIIKQFIKKIYGTEMDVIAISKVNFTDVIIEYKERSQKGTLPKPKPMDKEEVSEATIKVEKEPEDEIVKELKDIFDETINITMEE